MTANGSTTGTQRRPVSKADKRAAAKAAKAAAAQAAARKRLLRTVAVAAAALAVAGVLAWAISGWSGDAVSPPAAAASVTPAASIAAKPVFPPLPEGADPALGKKPAAAAVTGALAKLAVKTLIQGKGPAAKAGTTITVNYVGVHYQTGKEFDASWTRLQPFEFTLGAGNVIAGWDQGLAGVKVGSRVQLDIPAALAYGDKPTGGQPAGPLRFIVDVLSAR
ncbi:FKBP-type peptidyl-prolyl cis-trans isomerase [Catellatospora sp. NPDC049609]|uniref:FKBP-type peptidyl-prolyl cis-trans isomerase n=1 Tax=Catellatospora sp. NPDC049609 TaxID=3155505 RepID=UPI0034369A93